MIRQTGIYVFNKDISLTEVLYIPTGDISPASVIRKYMLNNACPYPSVNNLTMYEFEDNGFLSYKCTYIEGTDIKTAVPDDITLNKFLTEFNHGLAVAL